MVFIIALCTAFFFFRSVLTLLILRVEKSPIFYVDIMLVTIVSFATTTVLFVCIIRKLMASHAAVSPVSFENGSVSGVVAHQNTRRKHVTAVRTFVSVSICFVISYVLGYASAIGIFQNAFLLIYLLNHICNPAIYIMFNREFRASVWRLLRKG